MPGARAASSSSFAPSPTYMNSWAATPKRVAAGSKMRRLGLITPSMQEDTRQALSTAVGHGR